MFQSDAITTTPYASDLITRSDHMPSDLERYGHWALKFYGGGYHQAYKDGPEPIDRAMSAPLGAVALAH